MAGEFTEKKIICGKKHFWQLSVIKAENQNKFFTSFSWTSPIIHYFSPENAATDTYDSIFICFLRCTAFESNILGFRWNYTINCWGKISCRFMLSSANNISETCSDYRFSWDIFCLYSEQEGLRHYDEKQNLSWCLLLHN